MTMPGNGPAPRGTKTWPLIFAPLEARYEIGVTWPHPVFDQRGDRGEHDDGLRDPAAGIGLEPPAKLLELGGRGIRTHDEALPARPVDRLDHQFVESIADSGVLTRVGQYPGTDVADQRLLVQVVADHGVDECVDGLVVGHAVPGCVDDRYRAGAGRDRQQGVCRLGNR